MWKTLKRKLDGTAKAVQGQELPPPTHTEVDLKQKNLSSATISEVYLTGNTQKLAALECYRLNYADIIRPSWANLRQFLALLPVLCWFVNK